MTDRTRELGRLGEAAARKHLEARGLRAVASNVRTRYGELDLVCRAGRELVFVEVKTRLMSATVAPREAITAAKATRLIHLAEAYLAEQAEAEVAWRIDLVAVIVRSDGRVASVEHIQNAVTMP